MTDVDALESDDPPPPSPHFTAVGRLATATAEGLEELTIAARRGDAAAARRVLRRSAGEVLRAPDAELAVRRDLNLPASGSLRRTACELQVISLLAQVGELVDAFARQLANGRTPRPALDALTAELETLGGAGGRRLRSIGCLSAPAMDGEYLRAGAALRESLDRLGGGPTVCPASAGSGPSAASTCSCLIRAVLSASSVATRVA